MEREEKTAKPRSLLKKGLIAVILCTVLAELGISWYPASSLRFYLPQSNDHVRLLASMQTAVSADSTVSRFYVQYHIDLNKTMECLGHYPCKEGKTHIQTPRRFPKTARRIVRLPLHPSQKEALIGRTELYTNLKVFIHGDSLAEQFLNLWVEATSAEINSHRKITQNLTDWRFLGAATIGNDNSTSSSRGLVAGRKMMNLMLNETHHDNITSTTKKEGLRKWSRESVANLLHNWTIPGGSGETIGAFDVLILRIPHGHLTFDQITKPLILESIKLLVETYGFKSVIITTIHLDNNIRSFQEWEDWTNTNRMLRELAKNWTPSAEFRGLENLAVLDLAQLTNRLWEQNAKLIGYNTTNRTRQEYTLDRLGCPAYPPSIVSSCAEVVPVGQCQCERNMISVDGIHLCMNQLGPRLMAGWGCILSCFYEDDVADKKACASKCNERFMDIGPLRDVANVPRSEHTHTFQGKEMKTELTKMT